MLRRAPFRTIHSNINHRSVRAKGKSALVGLEHFEHDMIQDAKDEVEPYFSILGISDCFRIWLVKLKVALYVVCACVCMYIWNELLSCNTRPKPATEIQDCEEKKAACYVTLQLKHLPFYSVSTPARGCSSARVSKLPSEHHHQRICLCEVRVCVSMGWMSLCV